MSRRVLVTGGASGLGQALVVRFAASGDRVLATDRAQSDAMPLGVDFSRLDVREDSDWEQARDLVEQRWGGLDLLVNNAGIAAGGRIDVVSMAEWQQVLDVNLLGVVRGCRTFAPVFKSQRSGHIVNIASIAGLVHPPAMAPYSCAKAAVVALSETLSHELEPYDVTTSVVCPSFFRSGLSASMTGDDVDLEVKMAHLIDGSTLTAEDIADAVVEGIARRSPMILPDDVARASYSQKLDDRPAYDAQMATTAHRAFEREVASRGGAA